MIPPECGCDSYAGSAWGNNAAGLQAIGTDLGRTKKCGDTFAERIQSYGEDLKKLGETVAETEKTLGLSEKEGLPKLVAAVAEMKTSVPKIQAFGKAAESVKPALNGCEKPFQQASDMLSTAPPKEISPISRTTPLGKQ